ncbi:MAG: xylan 1,4-beta-xylosidase [Ruminococcaceae bacterium]|nr:xylan 1,4-beta-xylosidase [Oscillospiraceae bacterium]MBD5384649.1 xylan 1,4-beta-xylosidase [Oscillospiraceae bacterium]
MADKDRFVKTYSQLDSVLNATSTQIFVDTETGVNYVFHKDGYGGGLTPLLDKDGKPVVTPIEK